MLLDVAQTTKELAPRARLCNFVIKRASFLSKFYKKEALIDTFCKVARTSVENGTEKVAFAHSSTAKALTEMCKVLIWTEA